MGMAKSETSTSIEVKVPEVSIETSLLKSELEAAKAKTAELQKKVDLATDFFGKLNAKKSAPQGKAITSLDVIAKSEESKVEKNLSMSEVTSILAKKSADPSLSKSDRDAINEFYLGSKNIQLVRHLLT
jgi:subtilisin-like proprotein convertase family protein